MPGCFFTLYVGPKLLHVLEAINSLQDLPPLVTVFKNLEAKL